MDFYAGIYGLTGGRGPRPAGRADRADRAGAVPRPPGRPALRRLEAAAGAGLRPAAPAAAGLPRRADRRRRPGRPPRPVGPAVPARRRGDHAGRHHALHGRGRALRPGRLPVPVEAAGRRHAERAEATCPAVTPPGTRRLEIVGPDAAGLLDRLRRRPGGPRGDDLRPGDPRPGRRRRRRSPTCGPRACQVRPTGPNLEDVFVTLSQAARRRMSRAASEPEGAGRTRSAAHDLTADYGMPMFPSLLRVWSVARKELLHILRDPQTLFFTLFVPVLELFMLGYAIDTNVRARPHGASSTRPAPRRAGPCSGSSRTPTTSPSSRTAYSDAEAEPRRSSPARPGSASRSRRTTRGGSRPGRRPRCWSWSTARSRASRPRRSTSGNAIALRESLERALGEQAAAGRGPAAGPVQPRHPLGQLLHPRPDGRPVPDDGDHALGQRHRPREGDGHARAALHDAGAAGAS